jgi:ATP-dependent helicase/nuclease subunit A
MSGNDREARRLAATCFDRNLAVLAGAGTGKTSLLVERILNAVGSGAVAIGELAAITFTIKAAGEMRERLARALERVIDLATRDAATDTLDDSHAADRSYRWLVGEAGAQPAEIRRRALEAVAGLDRSTVETIHGFCANLLREFPLEAGVDPSFEVDQGEHFAAVLDEQWDAFVSKELGSEAPRPALWRRLREGLTLTDIETAGRGLAEFGVPAELLRPPYPFPDPRELFRDEVVRQLAAVADLLDREPKITQASRRKLANVSAALEVLADDGLEAFRDYLDEHPDTVAVILSPGRHPSKTKSLQVVTGEEFERIAKAPFQLARKLYNTDDELMRDLVQALSRFALDARTALLRRGYVGFDGLLVLARDLLRDHAEVRDALRRRVRMLLVDEFQDTDPLQYEIVLFLAEQTGGRASDAYDVELQAGRLFIVGDAKQSIYRFRGADYGAFRRAVAHVEAQGGRVVHLTSNYRSLPEVLEPINALFDASSSGSWKASPHQPEYVPIHGVREADAPGTRVELWTLDGDAFPRAEARRVAEGQVIAREIQRWVEEEGRLRYGDVTILLRAFTNLALYLRPLRERGIPFVVDGGREFLKRPEVGHLISALKVLAQPTDRVSLLAFLRSPAGGVPDTELAAWAAGGGRWDYAEEPGSELPVLAKAFAMLRELRADTLGLPADRVVRRVLERTGLLVSSAAAFEGAQRVANLRKLAAAAAELARHGELSLLEVTQALEAERTADVESDSPLADEGVEAVRVLTVHKAKGLENDVVIVADLARRDYQGAAWTPFKVDAATLPDGTRALALQCGRLRNATGVFFLDEELLHERAEENRVLYVALTRARDRLVVLGADSTGRMPWLEALAPWGYEKGKPLEEGALLAGGGVRHVRVHPERASHEEQLVELEGAPEAVSAYARAWDALRNEAKPPFLRPSGVREDDDAIGALTRDAAGAAWWRRRAAERASRSRATARVVGSVVHRALELWDGEPNDLVTTGARLARYSAAREQLDADEVRAEVAALLEGFVASPLAKRLGSVDVVGREVPMLHRRKDGATWGGSIDLIYRDEDGDFVVADYKTDDDPDEAEMRERYRDQLQVYAAAVREAQGLERLPRAELWLLRTGAIVDL